MTTPRSSFDVIISGASIAGSAAATLLARAGLAVAVLEQHTSLAHHKRSCTHYLQSSATPTLRRLGVVEELEAAGAVRNSSATYTRHGWIRPDRDPDVHGYSLRREKLDPILRRAAIDAGATVITSAKVTDVARTGHRVSGVAATIEGQRRTLRAPVVVGADGSRSTIAALAGLRTWTRAHGRFCYFGYFRGIDRDQEHRARAWFMGSDVAYQFPNDDDLTVLALLRPTAELEAFRHDPEKALVMAFESLPDAPDLSRAELVGRLQPMIGYTNQLRRAAGPGVALIGDAAATTDYLWGTGCGWALQSAEWLTETIAPVIRSGDAASVDRALNRYRRLHRRRLLGHWLVCTDYSRVRPFNALENLAYRAAARDTAVADHLAAFGERRISLHEFAAPTALGRMIVANLRAQRARPARSGVASP